MNSNDTCRRRNFCEFQKRFKGRIRMNLLILLSRGLDPLDFLLHVVLKNTLTSIIYLLTKFPCLTHISRFIKNNEISVQARSQSSLLVCNPKQFGRMRSNTLYCLSDRTGSPRNKIANTLIQSNRTKHQEFHL